ncbi:MAG: PAS domain S-box protein [Verrucomicrobiota bacterium]|nr:PAS domain S-box protein [Verrucomicrobiota bacterium]
MDSNEAGNGIASADVLMAAPPDPPRKFAKARENIALYRLFFQSNPMPAWVFDEGSLRFLAVNDAAIQCYGYSREEFLAMTVKDIRPAEEIPAFLKYLAAGAADRPEPRRIWKHCTSKNETLLVETLTRPVMLGKRPACLVLANNVTERKRTEDRLRRSEKSLANAQRIAHIGNWDWDIAADELYWSEQVYQLFGVARTEFGARYEAFLNSVHPDDRERVHKVLESALAGSALYDVKHRVLLPDGSIRLLHELGEVTRDDDGNPIRMTGTVQDITEAQLAEQGLRESEARLNEAQRTAQIGSWRYLPDGTLTWSDAMYALYRMPRDVPPTHEAILAVIHPDDRASRDQAALARTLESDVAAFEIEYRVIWPDGQVRHLCSRATLNRDADGKLIEAVGTVQDVTDRVKSESDRAQLAAIVAASNASIISYSTAGTILSWNKGAELQYGYSAAEVIGKSIDLLYPPERLHERDSLLASLKAGTSIMSVEATRVRKDGARIEISGSFSPTLNARGEVTGGATVSHDISARKKAERELRRSESSMAAAQRIAHFGSWETDLTTMSVTWSAETYRIFGVAPEIGMTHEMFLQLVHPDDRVKVQEAFAECGTGEQESCAIAHRLLLPDGQIKFVEERWQVTRDADGTPRRAAGTCQDVTEERTASAALRATIESALDCIVMIDETDTILEFNPAAERTFGLSRADAINRPLATTIIPPRYREGHLRGMAAFMRSGQTVITGNRIEISGLRADGTEFPLELTVSRIGDGRPAVFTAFMRDITERVTAEEKLRSQEEQYRSLFQHNPNAMWVHELKNDRLLAANDAAVVQYGYSRDELLALTLVDLWPDGEREDPAARAEREGAPSGFTGTFQHRRKDGSSMTVEVYCTPITYNGTEAQMAVLFDITERERAEAQMRLQASMIDLAHDAIVVRDLDNRVELWNRGAENLYGWTADEVKGRRLGDFLYPDPKPFLIAKQSMLRAGDWTGELKQLCKDGRTVTVRSRWTLLESDAGKPRSILAINTDITEQKALEAQFMRAQRLESIGTLASGVAHDLNNILSPILMSVPLLRTPLSDEGREKILSLVEQSAERGAAVVKQVLTFARGADGEKVLVQPAYLVKEITQIAEETFPNNITVRSQCADDLWLISGDATELHQVLLNLCVNARDAMPEGGSLSIKTENFEVDAHYASMTPGAHAGPHVLLTVSDTGTGIPPQVLDKIFDPFFTTKQEGKGTGLGLSTALGIVKNHGGVLNVESTAKGTTFHVLLPAAPGAHQASATADPVDLPRGQGETILIVDDEPVTREVAQALLALSGYIVLTADDGPAALAIFARRSAEIRLVMTDFAMPLMSGMTLARALRKMDASTKIVISMGRDEDCNPAEAKSIGIEATLAKPYTQEKLLRTLDRLLHAAAPGTS